MKLRNASIISSVLLILSLSSCVTYKKLTYMQYMSKLDNSIMTINNSDVSVTPAAYRLMPYDNLYIRVITPDPQWSEIFNSVPTGGGGALTQESAALMGYLVDERGYIELPFAGKLEVANKPLSVIKVELDSIFKKYVNDASITVRMVNNYISIIGEVRAPGRYTITHDRTNVFEALSMAGDMTEYGKRQNVQLIRPSPDGPVISEFSLLDKNILSSELYYIMPNDIIYVPPLRARTFQVNSSTYSLILSSIATILTSVTTLYLIFGINQGSN